METGGQKSVGAASGGGDGACSGGHLCHLCGYKFASAHPSAKQRRAHRKNCGGGKSPPSAAAAATAEVAEDRQEEGKKLLLDECEAEAGGGEGNGAGASDSAASLPGSAQDVRNAVEDGDSGVHSSPNGAGAQVIISDNIISEVAPKANGTEIQTEVAMQLSENAPHHVEALHPAESHVSGDQSQDASASHRQPELEDGAKFSPDISADDISESNGVSLTPNAASDEISATVGSPGDTVVTEKDCLVNNIEEDKASEDMLVKGSEIIEGHSATIMEKDDNLSVVSVVQIPSAETESKEESEVIRTNSVEQALGNKEPYTDKHVHTGDARGDDLSELDSGGCHLEAADVVKTQQQTDSISVVAEQLTNSKQADLEEEQSHADADEVIQAAWSATGPAGSTGDLTVKDPSEVTTEDCIQSNSSHPSGTIFVPSQIDLVEPTSDPTSHEISMISSKEDFDDDRLDENISADLTSCDRTKALGVSTEETTSHETKTVCSTDIGEIKHIGQITAEASPPESSVLQSTCSVKEKKQIEEVIADPASYKVDVMSSRDIVVEKEESDVSVGTAHEINVVNIPANVELKKHSEEITSDPTALETNIMNITDNSEEEKQNEETTTDPVLHAIINVTCSPSNDDKMQDKEMSEVPSSHKNAMVDGTYNVKEKDEEPMPDPTSYNMDAASVDVVEGKKQEEEVTAEPNSVINVVHAVDNAMKNEGEEPASSCKIDAGSNAASILTVDPGSHGNNKPQGMDDAAEKNQNEKVAADHASDNIPAAQSTDDAAEKKQKDETATTEISTTKSADGDQNEEITDKEMTIDSDKSHVSLKSLLSEKGTDTKEKEKKAGTKDRVLSFRRRSSKDNPSPGKPGSAEQDWNSPARLPVEKSPKGKKQPWMPFICCHSMN